MQELDAQSFVFGHHLEPELFEFRAGGDHVATHEIPQIDTDTPLLGWCRGIAFEGDHIWVGFSRLRPTKARENVAWVKDGFKRQVGTHIARYDLTKRSLEQRIDLEPAGLNAVFSIYEV